MISSQLSDSHQHLSAPLMPHSNSNRFSSASVVVLLFGLLWLLAGCGQATASQSAAALPAAINTDDLVSDIEDYVFPTPTPAPELPEDSFVVIQTGGARANLRGGPGTDYDIISKGYPGETYEIVGRSEDGEWWEICCVAGPEDGEGEATLPVWVASSVATTEGAAEAIAVGGPLLDMDVEAKWSLDWYCGSERCSVSECAAEVTATGGETANQQWIPIEHQVAWEDSCFPADSWAFEVDQYTGTERTGEFADNFLYSYWVGAEPGEANGVVELEDGRNVAVSCSGPHSVEISEGDGWITVYEGQTCHDVRTGLLVLLNYTKRWLFTGEFDGHTYDRAYFGDSETLQQTLDDTNLELMLVESAP